MLDLMTYDNFVIASRNTVDGTLALERVFASPQLDFFLMLSSASNIVGTSAQGNYNAGNAVQDAIANMRSNKPCQFISLNIGWIEDAVATVNNNQRRKGLSRAGLRSIAPDELLRFLDHALVTATKKKGASQMIIGFDTNSLSEASNSSGNGNVHCAMFRHVYNPDKLSSSSLAPGTLSFKDLAAEGNHGSLIDFVATSIANKLTKLISTDAVRILSENGSILELGLDSLVAIELRNWIVREFEAPLQSSEVVLDQTIRMLADKVVDRSRTSSAGANKQVGSTTAQELPVWNSSGRNPGVLQFTPSSVPLPLLENTLHSFQESRRAVDSEADQKSLADAVSSFLDGTGQALQRQLEILEPGVIAENYESQIYLQRREPLQDYSLFAIIHPVEAPTHSQAMRAALLTVAAIQFADGQASGVPRSDSTRGVGVRSDAQNWLFYATRRPEVGVDRIVCSPPNRSVVVLRRGHVFQLALGDAGASLSLSAMETSYTAIIDSSNDIQMRVCALTADERDSWALVSA
ncbi:hypothetical protein F4801DRAFT_343535 [Xylaria longipes]|nr:hypothetical protein F4801DRAFT_343535 [Xylaria longipes]